MYVKFMPVKGQKHLQWVKTRYAVQIAELESLGFQDVCIYYDFAPPYYLFKSFLSTFILKFLVDETWDWAWPMTYATICSLRCHLTSGTYVNTCGLGSIFYTELADGTLCISASWGGDDLSNDTARVFKHYFAKPDACGLNMSDIVGHALEPALELDAYLPGRGADFPSLTGRFQTSLCERT